MTDESRSSDSDSSRGPAETRRHKWLEATAAVVGAALASATLVVLVWEGLRGTDAPPDVTLEVVGITPSAGGYVVEVRAENLGDRTAAELVFEGVLTDHGHVVEAVQGTFDYVPSRSRRRGGLVFEHDPRALSLKVRALGFAEP